MGLWRRTFFSLLFWRAGRSAAALRALCRRFDVFASQFKRSANELRGERADPEGARRGEARESTLTRMQAGRRFSADASFALSSRRFQRVLTRAEGVSPPQTRNGIFCGVGRINSCFAGAAKRRHCPRCLAARIARSRICALRGKGGIETPA